MENRNEIPIKLKRGQSIEKAGENWIDYIVPHVNHNNQTHLQEYRQTEANYKLYNNILDQEDLKRCLNPLNIDIESFVDDIMPYNKTYENIQRFLGEELGRNEQLSAGVLAENYPLQLKIELKEKYRESILNQMRILTEMVMARSEGMDEEEIMALQEEYQDLISPDDIDPNEFKIRLEVLCNHILRYGRKMGNIEAEKNKGFFHALMSDKEIVWVGVRNNKVVYEVMNSQHTYFRKGPEIEFIEDGDGAGCNRLYTVQGVLRNFGPMMKKKDLKEFLDEYNDGNHDKDFFDHGYGASLELEALWGNPTSWSDTERIGSFGESYVSHRNAFEDLVWVAHAEWIMYKDVNFLIYQDVYGRPVVDLVDVDFKAPEDAQKVEYVNVHGKRVKALEWIEDGVLYKLEKMSIPRKYEGYRIDGKYYCGIKESEYQMAPSYDPYHKCRLGYHGGRYNSTNAPSLSIMSRMRPFQYVYFFVFNHIVELLSRFTGPIVGIDLAQIDPQIGDGDMKLAIQETLYNLRKGVHFFNSQLNVEFASSLPSTQATGRVEVASVTADLLNLIQVLEWLERQIYKSVGFSDPRVGNTSPYSNVSDNRQALSSSTTVTEILFFKHQRIWERVMDSYLTIFMKWAKRQFELYPEKENIAFTYILTDKSVATFEITREDLLDLEMGVFIHSNTSTAEQYISTIQNLTMNMADHDSASIATLSEILLARDQGLSPAEVHDRIKEFEKEAQQRENEMQQQQQEAQMQMQQAQQQAQMQAHQMEIEKIKTKGEIDMAIESMKLGVDIDRDNDGRADALENEKLELQKEKTRSDIRLNEQRMQLEREKLSKPNN